MLSLLKSRKFWLAVGGLAGVIAVQFGMDEGRAQNVIQAAIALLDAVLIGGIAVEDHGAKLGAMIASAVNPEDED